MMSNLPEFLQLGVPRRNPFPITSRYNGVETAEFHTTDGRTIVYLRRRFVPNPDDLALLEEHMVAGGDRLDLLAAAYYGDPEQYWRICDANRAMRPDDLTAVVGLRIRIPLPEGVQGSPVSGGAGRG